MGLVSDDEDQARRIRRRLQEAETEEEAEEESDGGGTGLKLQGHISPGLIDNLGIAFVFAVILLLLAAFALLI